tara:strand:+ start:930 stop:1448 length:519 start_codon:yes stop_codon:yes gene_type:complete
MINEFEAPLPGQSLAGGELGQYPWESPPDFPDPNDAFSYYMERILDDDQMVFDITRLLEIGTPVEVITEGILFQSFQLGQVTPDVTILLREPLADLIRLVGKEAGVEVEEQDPLVPELQERLAEEIFAEERQEDDGEELSVEDTLIKEAAETKMTGGLMDMPEQQNEEQVDG